MTSRRSLWSSATEYCRLVITVPGQIESASTLPYQRQLTGGSHGVIDAVFTISRFEIPSPQYSLSDTVIHSATETSQYATTVQKTMGQSAIILRRSDTRCQRTMPRLSKIEHQFPTPPKVHLFWSLTCLMRRNILPGIGSRSIQKARGGICLPQSTRSMIPLVPRIRRMRTTASMETFLLTNQEYPQGMIRPSREPILWHPDISTTVRASLLVSAT